MPPVAGRSPESKSRQVHFWASPAVLQEFEAAARELGEKVTDAHRAALQNYVDSNVLEGCAFLLESEISIHKMRVALRLFSRGEDELVLRVKGRDLAHVIAALRQLGAQSDWGARLAAALLAPRTSTGRGGRSS